MEKRKHLQGYRGAFCLLMLVLMGFSACSLDRKVYRIGVSQCSEDYWRSKLEAEMDQSTYFNEDVQLILCSADDDVEQQKRQIDSLISLKVDLLIVSPQQASKLSESIHKATEAKIPVILFDRKSDAKDYTAFMGADNYHIGVLLADFTAARLGGKGNVVEIAGEPGSSPAIERHKGYTEELKKYPGIHVVGFAEGDWKQPSGERAMEQILESPELKAMDYKIDCVFGGNDRMAIGARQAIEHFTQTHSEKGLLNPSHIIYLGVDAMPTPGAGIEKIRDGVLTASAIYPTHGDELVQLALNILKGEPYEKNTEMETSIVTADNANLLLLQHEEVVRQHQYIKRMHNRVDRIISTVNLQQFLMFFIIFVAIVVAILLVVAVRALRAKHALNKELIQKNDELNDQKEMVEQQRDELENERDKLIEEKLKHLSQKEMASLEKSTEEASSQEEPQNSEQAYQKENQFMQKFNQCVEEHMADSDFSVEDLGQEMCLSRVQLYRKVKALTGSTPVELIRQARLQKAQALLTDTSLSISEVAYKVGFSAPSYFTKCYKDYFGKAPTA